MMRSLTFLTLATSAVAFAPSSPRPAFVVRPTSLSMSTETAPYHVETKESEAPTSTMEEPSLAKTETNTQAPVEKKSPPKKKPTASSHKQGPLSPLVLFAKGILGDETLNKVRGKAISLHSDVIGSFVETSETAFGDTVLRSLFRLSDKNGDGLISEEELQSALRSLGFSWLQEKQVNGIFKRADLDENGSLDMTEFMKEAPKTLRTNLIKMAKKNGGDMGLLV